MKESFSVKDDMKEYPSIMGPKGSEPLPCIAFYKYDGSNLRFEWSRKTGWYKYGTRQRLFAENDPEYGCAIELFQNKYGESIVKAIKDYRHAESIVAYCEFFGPNSFAGQHVADDPKEVMLFDVNVFKKGFLGPREFLKTFGHLDVAKVVYTGLFDEQFINDVREGKYPVAEGVIAKGGNGANHTLWFRKVKTWAYLQELKRRYYEGWNKLWE